MATTTARSSESSGFLNWIERVGNKVPNPTIMFVYLIGFVAVLSALLAWAGVSVTDEVVVPVPRDEFNQINEHLGGTWSIYDSTTGEPAVVPDYVLSDLSRPSRSATCCPSRACATSSPPSSTTSPASAWWPRSSSRWLASGSPSTPG